MLLMKNARGLAASLCLFAASLPAQSARSVTILHLNDSHSNFVPGAPRDAARAPTVGGLARVATIVAHERQRRQNVLVLHSGDLFVGDPMFNFFFGVPELQLLAQLRPDAMAVGNHEFDLTPATLMASLATAFPGAPPFPLLSANLDLSAPAVHPLQNYVRPYTIRDFAGLRIGVFGLTTPLAMQISMPQPVVVLPDVVTIAADTVAVLQAAGCDAVVLLSHLGLALDLQVAGAVPGIDVILSGHDHYPLADPIVVQRAGGGTTTLVQTGGFYRQLDRLELRVLPHHVDVRHEELIDLDRKVAEQPAIRAQVAALVAAAEVLFPGMYSAPVATATATFEEKALHLDRPGRHDTAVGNLLADALLDFGHTDVAIVPCGTTAQPIHVGPVVPVDLFRAVGYGFNTYNGLGFSVATYTVPGLGLWMGLEQTLAELPDDSDYLVQVSDGFAYAYDPQQPPLHRLVAVTIDGQPIDPTAFYSVTSNEFTLAFVAAMGLPVFDVTFHQVSEFELLYGYAAALGTLTPYYPTPRVLAVGN